MQNNHWWTSLSRQSGAAGLRLFCFSHAGGSALAYRRWQSLFSRFDIEVCAIQLPGRENRLREPPYSQIGPLVAALIDVVRPATDRPYACFAHSMGTLVAFELAHGLRAAGLPEPVGMVMSAHRAPNRPRSRRPLHALGHDALVAALRELGGTPDAVLDDPSLVELLLPTLRADFSVTETYQPAPRPQLCCPITVFGATADPRVDRDELEAWRLETQGAFDLRMFEGGHFYLKDREAEVVSALQVRLEAWR